MMKDMMDEIADRALDRGVEIPEQLTMEFLESLGIPLVVACTACDMTMVCGSAKISEDGHFWCGSCAEAMEQVAA